MIERIDLFYCHDSLGSVTAVMDSGGNVVERYAYEAYGKTTVLNPDRSVKSSQVPVQPYGFTGRRMDYEEGSGLYYYRLRYYDPEAGRFISRDPLGMWGDPGQRGSAQNYCGNNPVNRIDPMGLEGAASQVLSMDKWYAKREAYLGHLLNNPEGFSGRSDTDAVLIEYTLIGEIRNSFGRPAGTLRYDAVGVEEAGGVAGIAGGLSASSEEAGYEAPGLWAGAKDGAFVLASNFTFGFYGGDEAERLKKQYGTVFRVVAGATTIVLHVLTFEAVAAVASGAFGSAIGVEYTCMQAAGHGGKMGVTSSTGRMLIEESLATSVRLQTIRHEAVHWFSFALRGAGRPIFGTVEAECSLAEFVAWAPDFLPVVVDPLVDFYGYLFR